MDNLEKLEKLGQLRDKKIITEEEFLNQKQSLLGQTEDSDNETKSGVAYVLLAWFLGAFGAHNFYAGYTKRAIVQLLLTLFSWMLFFIPLIVVQIWALADMCLIDKDAAGRPFKGDKAIIMILRIAGVTFYVLGYFFGFMNIFMNYSNIASGVQIGTTAQGVPGGMMIIR